MDFIGASFGLLFLIIALMVIAINSIGIESYNKLKSLKTVDEGKKFATNKESNFNYLVCSLICAIILTIVACVMCIAGFSPMPLPLPMLAIKFGDAEI